MNTIIYTLLFFLLPLTCFPQVSPDNIYVKLNFRDTEGFYVPDSIHNEKTILQVFVKVHFDNNFKMQYITLETLIKKDIKSGKILFKFQKKVSKKRYPKKVKKYYIFLKKYFEEHIYFDFHVADKNKKTENFRVTWRFIYKPKWS